MPRRPRQTSAVGATDDPFSRGARPLVTRADARRDPREPARSIRTAVVELARRARTRRASRRPSRARASRCEIAPEATPDCQGRPPADHPTGAALAHLPRRRPVRERARRTHDRRGNPPVRPRPVTRANRPPAPPPSPRAPGVFRSRVASPRVPSLIVAASSRTRALTEPHPLSPLSRPLSSFRADVRAPCVPETRCGPRWRATDGGPPRCRIRENTPRSPRAATGGRNGSSSFDSIRRTTSPRFPRPRLWISKRTSRRSPRAVRRAAGSRWRWRRRSRRSEKTDAPANDATTRLRRGRGRIESPGMKPKPPGTTSKPPGTTSKPPGTTLPSPSPGKMIPSTRESTRLVASAGSPPAPPPRATRRSDADPRRARDETRGTVPRGRPPDVTPATTRRNSRIRTRPATTPTT